MIYGRSSVLIARRSPNRWMPSLKRPKSSVRGCDSGLLADRSASACSFALAALVVWFEIGVWRTLGGPTPADDVDLTLMIREGQTGQVKRPPNRPRPGMSRGPVVRGPELLMRSGVSAGVCTTPWEPWRGGPHLDWRRPPRATCPMGHL
jgi:hypothetical protein